jgi:glycosyltransferase involved in cell wall biosynthesis
MKSILFIHQGTGIGGASLCLKELLDEFRDEYDITVLCIFQSEAVDYFRNSGYKTEVLNTFFYRKMYMYFYHSEAYSYNLFKPIAFIRAIISYLLNLYFAKKVIDKYKPSLIHLNSSVLTDWAVVGKKKGIKVVIHVREPIAKGFFGLRLKILRKIINKYTDHIIAISKDNARRLGLSDKTTIVYDPIRDIPEDNIENKKNNLHYFSYFGGTQSIKGFIVLAESLKYLDNDVRIYFGGHLQQISKGTSIVSKLKYLLKLSMPGFRKQLRCLSIIKNSEKVIILGIVENVYNYIRNSDALLFPSTKPHFADPVLEAYKLGIPVIVSDVDGMEEIVSKDTGILFKKNSSQNLASAINKLSKMDENQINLYKKNCLAKYALIFDKNNKVLDVIHKILI